MIDGVVADALEVADGVEQAGDRTDVRHGHAVLGDVHQIAAQPVLISVQLVLIFQDLASSRASLIAGELLQCQQHIVPGQFAHPVQAIDTHSLMATLGVRIRQGIQEGKLLGGVFPCG